MKDFLSKARNDFVRGLAVIFPITLTIVILKWLLKKLNIWFLDPFVGWIRPYVGSIFVIFLLKLAVFAFIIAFIVFCGAATRIIFIKKFFGLGEQLFTRMPVISKIYLMMKEISVALFGKKRGLFKRVVLVEFPRQGLWSIAFVTREHVEKGRIRMQMEDEMTSVFVPTTPNPTTGMFLLVKKKDLVDVDMSLEHAIKLIISGGAIFPADRIKEFSPQG